MLEVCVYYAVSVGLKFHRHLCGRVVLICVIERTSAPWTLHSWTYVVPGAFDADCKVLPHITWVGVYQWASQNSAAAIVGLLRRKLSVIFILNRWLPLICIHSLTDSCDLWRQISCCCKPLRQRGIEINCSFKSKILHAAVLPENLLSCFRNDSTWTGSEF